MADRSRSPDNANFFLSWFKWIAGAAFPANPFLYRPFFRTDLGWLCYWDGTRWLTTHEFPAQFAAQFAIGASSTLTSVEIRADYSPFVTRATVSERVNTTNDGTNFWQISLRGINVAYGAATTIHTFSTGTMPDTAGTIYQKDSVPTGTQTPSNKARLDVAVTKNSAPGTLDFYGMTAYYRMIVT